MAPITLMTSRNFETPKVFRSFSSIRFATFILIRHSEMAGANIFEIMNRPRIPFALYEEFVNEFGSLIEGTTAKMSNAWTEFQETAGRPRKERMELVEIAFITSLVDWQELVSRAEHEIGGGNFVVYPDVYEQFGLVEIEYITMTQLKKVEQEMYDLIGIMREILRQAATRIEEVFEEIGNAA